MRAPVLLLLLAACAVGSALPARAQQRGDVVITEVGVNPLNPLLDANAEWFELFNNSPLPIDLQNWMVRDSAASGPRPVHRINSSLVVPPYGFVVLGNTVNTTTNGGVPVQYAYGAALALANSLDRVTILSPDSVNINFARYASAAISAQDGISRERLNVDLAVSNDTMDTAYWANALVTDVYGPGGRGTPGVAGQTSTNGLVPSVPVTTSAVPGYRLLSPPLGRMDVALLRHLNLVQGLTDEFPTFGANIFTGYSGNPATGYGGFIAPTASADVLTPGRGFLWYMYGEGGPVPEDPRGLSRRAELPVTLWVGGLEHTDDVATPFTAEERAGAADQFYMLGNPFNQPFDLSGLTASSGTLSNVVQLYNPEVGYVVRTRVPGTADDDASDDVAVWEGFLAEFFAPPTLPFTFSYEADARTATTPPFSGRTVGGTDYARVGLALDGVTAAGAATHDRAAEMYFSPLATLAWDAYDASKLGALSSPAALIAPVGPGPDGTPRWHAQRSLPLDLAGPFTTPVAFMATDAGTYTFSVPTFEGIPAGWQVTLTDHETGAVTTLAPGATYAFDSAAGSSAERFALTIVPGAVTATEAPALASAYALAPVTPNPSVTGARAELQVRDAQDVRAEVFDVLGRRLAVVFDGALAAGATQALEIRSGDLPAGAYVLRVTGAGFAAAQTFHVAR